MDSHENNTPAPIDLLAILRRFWKALKKLWLLILLLAILFGAFGYINARRSFVPRYECKAILSVGSGYSMDDIFSSDFYYDSMTAQQIASSFPDVLNTEYMRDLVCTKLGTSGINGSIKASAIANTNMLQLTVRSANAQAAYDILMAVIECYPQAAVYMVDNPIIYVREEPSVPTTPINTFSARSAVLRGAAKGFLLGMAITVVFALLTQTVVNADELKKIINLPILASFPLISVKRRRKSAQTFLAAGDNPGMEEALRGLRTKVKKYLADKDGNVVLLTSTMPGEGKTTVSTNLALSLAAEGHRVVLVDADLRNQSIGRLFRTGQNAAGFMDCLRNPSLPISRVLREIPGSNLCYISGSSTQKRHYSLDGKAVRRVMDALSREFDYVVVDTPPCGMVSDTALLSRYATCVLYVVKMDYANKSQILDSVTGLYQRDVPLTGCVINGAAARSSRYGYGYGYAYGYGYGYGKNYGYGKKHGYDHRGSGSAQ